MKGMLLTANTEESLTGKLFSLGSFSVAKIELFYVWVIGAELMCKVPGCKIGISCKGFNSFSL